MKVLLSYASHFDKGEGVHYGRVLRRLGHEVFELNVGASANDWGEPGRTVSGFAAEVTIDELIQLFGPLDLFLYIEPLGLIPRGLEKSAVPTACVICDTHRNLEARRVLARLFDHVFLYQRNYLRAFEEHPPGALHWLPYACDTDVFRDLDLERDLDIGFVGQLFEKGSERRKVLDHLVSRYRVNESRKYLQEEIPSIYSRSKIVVNLPVGDDLNFRFFEALSCGAMLLTRRMSNGQELLFREGEHYAAFADQAELFDKVEYYLAHGEERQRIAALGAAEVRSKHTLDIRVADLLNKVRAGPINSAPVRRMGSRGIVRTYSSVLERMGRIESILRLAAHYPEVRWIAQAYALRAVFKRMLKNW
jgi:glycosyltransferase involved in cell wall biosynthesis